MIAPLRRAHRVLIVCLTLLLAVFIVLALRARPEPATTDELPLELAPFSSELRSP